MLCSGERKADAVVRLLEGEMLETLSHELGVETHRLVSWREEFVAAGRSSLGGRLRPSACADVLAYIRTTT